MGLSTGSRKNFHAKKVIKAAAGLEDLSEVLINEISRH